MWWQFWRVPDEEQRPHYDEYWIDSATADGSPWSDDDIPDQSTEPSSPPS